MSGLLVFGRTGQVARELARRAPDAQYLDRETVDLTDPAACAAAIAESDCAAVINAAAYTAVDRAESDAETARLVNADSPAAMARAAAATGVPFLHVSTDYVFDGARAPNPRRPRRLAFMAPPNCPARTRSRRRAGNGR